MFKDFFSTSNKINENTVMGVFMALCMVVSIMWEGLEVSQESIYTMAGMTMGFFGLSLGKKKDV